MLNHRPIIALFCVCVLALFTASPAVSADVEAKKTPKQKQQRIPTFPLIELHTSEGLIVLELDGRKAPITVRNYVEYVNAGHYNGTIFHRVIPGFMAQAGGYDGDLAEKPTNATIPNESGNGLKNARGTIAMARLNSPHSASAQFYINLADNFNLDPSDRRWGYAVFGEVIEGMDVVDKIALIPTGPKASFRSDVPTKTITIEKANLRKKR